MDEMIKTVYIIHLDGVPLLSLNIDGSKDQAQTFEELFGGLSSAIATLLKELGHKELKSISAGDGLLVYSSREPVLFVVHTENPKYEQFTKILVKQIEHQFFREFEHYLKQDTSYVRGERYTRFKSNILDLYNHLLKIRKDYPELIGFLPSFIPLSQLYMVLNLGLDIIKKFPDDTIKLVREVPNYFDNDREIEALVTKTIGRYAGHILSKDRFKGNMVIDQTDVLKMMNEISVVKYDKKQDLYDVVLCPVCRGRESEIPMCHFFSGFIEGALGNPSISVEQVSCKACGDTSCKFQLHRE